MCPKITSKMVGSSSGSSLNSSKKDWFSSESPKEGFFSSVTVPQTFLPSSRVHDDDEVCSTCEPNFGLEFEIGEIVSESAFSVTGFLFI